MNIVALIPARAGSKRIPGKNTKPLGGKPLIQWTIEAAHDSGVFEQVLVSSEDDEIRKLAVSCGADAAVHRRDEHASDDAPDIAWIRPLVEGFDRRPFVALPRIHAFAILRPTSPFRSSDAIRRGWSAFLANQPADSLRAIRIAKEHPGKMWRFAGSRLVPLYPFHHPNGCAWHSSPTQTLPPVFVQTASLEIAWTKTVLEQDSISGSNILPFTVTDWDAFDINTPDDWDKAEAHAQQLLARVP